MTWYLNVRSLENSIGALCAATVPWLAGGSYSPSTAIHYLGYAHRDPILAYLGAAIGPPTLLPLEESLGCLALGESRHHHVVLSPPEQLGYSEAVDYGLFGRKTLPAASVEHYRLRGGKSPVVNENDVRHQTLKGSAYRTGLGEYYPLDTVIEEWGLSLTAINPAYRQRVESLALSMGAPIGETRSGASSQELRFFYPVLLEELQEQITNLYRSGTFSSRVYETFGDSFEWKFDGNTRLTVEYAVRHRTYQIFEEVGSKKWAEYLYRYTLTFVLARDFPGSSCLADGGHLIVNPYGVGHLTYEISNFALGEEQPIYNLDYSGTHRIDFVGKATCLSRPAVDGITGISNPLHVQLKNKVETYASDFRLKYKKEINELSPAVFFSTANAIEEYLGVLSSNYLENILQLDGIFDVVPDAVKILGILKDVRSMNLLGSGAKMLDVISEGVLAKSFAIDPTLRDIQEFSEKYDEVKKHVQQADMFGDRTLYGKFVFELPPGSLGRDQAVLVAKSKARVTFNDNSLLAAYMGGKALGILPTLSNLWDLVPFSFAIDWFYNIGQRLEDIDNRVFMMLLPCSHVVHSLYITTDFNDDEMSDLQISSPYPRASDEYPGMRIYERFVSKRLPTLRESFYDFRAAGGVPNITLGGSLLWTLFRRR
jgi:hypothetical protein